MYTLQHHYITSGSYKYYRSKHSKCWWLVKCYVSTQLCWERTAQMPILPLWQHAHLQLPGQKCYLIGREGAAGCHISAEEWPDNEETEGCQKDVSAMERHQWLVLSYSMSPLCPPEAPRNADQQETTTPEHSGQAVHLLYCNQATYSIVQLTHTWIIIIIIKDPLAYFLQWPSPPNPRYLWVFSLYCCNQQLNTFSLMWIKSS